MYRKDGGVPYALLSKKRVGSARKLLNFVIQTCMLNWPASNTMNKFQPKKLRSASSLIITKQTWLPHPNGETESQRSDHRNLYSLVCSTCTASLKACPAIGPPHHLHHMGSLERAVERAGRFSVLHLLLARAKQNLGDLYAESGQTLQGSFSAVSKPHFASQY